MDAVSYPEQLVSGFINEKVIPLRVAADAKPLADDFRVMWTPTLVLLDPQGREHHRTVGFLPPEDLVASLMLGMAKVGFDNGQYQEALSRLNALLELYPRSSAAPEALYLRGVCGYKATHDARPLKEAYEQLQKEHPHSEWAKRALPYRLL